MNQLMKSGCRTLRESALLSSCFVSPFVKWTTHLNKHSSRKVQKPRNPYPTANVLITALSKLGVYRFLPLVSVPFFSSFCHSL